MGSDLFLLLVGFLGGAFSVVTPCVLVMLPVILAVSGGGGRRRAWGIVAGLETSFIGISILFGAALGALGLPPRWQEYVAAAIMFAFGLVFLVPWLRHRFENATSRLSSKVPTRSITPGAAGDNDGFAAGFVGGLGLGLVWAPCAGPILAFVTAAANVNGFGAQSIAVAFAYGLGMLGPLIAVMFAGRSLVTKIRSVVGGRKLDIGSGIVMILMGVAVLTGGVTNFNREVAERVNLTSTPIAGLERSAIEQSRDSGGDVELRADGTLDPEQLIENGYPENESDELENFGPAPELRGIHEFYNTKDGDPITLEELEGKVVLIDFWTYSCINCIRTLPFLRSWHDKYEDDGLVIVGVHTPEFAFEADEGNVQRAIDDLDVEWPVATDPDFDTWKNYHNRFWPAKYLIDKDGIIRYVHYGEGKYDLTEEHIVELLETEVEADADGGPSEQTTAAYRTPETYLGVQRINPEQYRGVPTGETTPNIVPGKSATYTVSSPADKDLGLSLHQYALTGSWRMEGERSVATGPDSKIVINYQAKDVFLVLGPEDESDDSGKTVGTISVTDKGGQGEPSMQAINANKLYVLRDGSSASSGIMTVAVPKGVAAYAFTFG